MPYWPDKVVVVTGGSAGFGLALAKRFASAGARVVLVARDEERLKQAAQEMAHCGAPAQPMVADVTDDAQVEHCAKRILEEFGRVDALINNAGRSTRGRAADTTVETFDSLLQLNFLAAVRCTRTFLPALLDSKGHLVLMGSLASKAATTFLGAYPASKAPLSVYAQQLRLELRPEGVHVLLVCPGPIARDDAGERYDDQAADLPASARQPGGGVKLKGIPPDQLADQVLMACERRRAELIVPRKARLLFALSALRAEWGDAILRRLTNG